MELAIHRCKANCLKTLWLSTLPFVIWQCQCVGSPGLCLWATSRVVSWRATYGVTAVAVGRIHFPLDSWSEGLAFSLAVGQRPPSAPCPMGLFLRHPASSVCKRRGPPRLVQPASPSFEPNLGSGATSLFPCSVHSRQVTKSGSHSRVGGRFAQKRASGDGGHRSCLPRDVTVPVQIGRDRLFGNYCCYCNWRRGLGCLAMKLRYDQATFPVPPIYQNKFQSKISM